MDDKKFVLLKCLFEGALNVELKNLEFGEQVSVIIQPKSKKEKA
jgi:hypothetical protein